MFESTAVTESYISQLAPKGRRSRKQQSWRSKDSKATLRKQAAIRDLLATGLSFTVRAIGDALGITRQLALYHIKKMAAQGRLIMVLEPCEKNGGLQFKVWDETALMAHYALRARAVLAA